MLASLCAKALSVDLDTGEYIISSAQDLVDFATKVNTGETNINARLTADIDMNSVAYTAIGTETNPFGGTFDGKGHVISNLIISSEEDCLGLIGCASGNVTVRNVILDNTCSISGRAFIGGIVGCMRGDGTITIQKCGNEGSVTASAQNAGGILGCNYDIAQATITDCYNTGAIIGGNESAAMSGWLGGGSITNCYNTGSVIGQDGNNSFARGAADFQNCYETIGSQVVKIDAAIVSTGELCYHLNGDSSENPTWFQTLGQDNHPVLFSTHKTVSYVEGSYMNGSLCYSLNSADYTASVTAAEGGYSGNISIPKTHKDGDVTYTVTGISAEAFKDCSGLIAITIPETIVGIGDGAFDGCINLTSVTVNNPNPVSITSNTFSNSSNAKLYVPDGSLTAYSTADNWKDFNEIVEMKTDYDISSAQELVSFAARVNAGATNINARLTSDIDMNGVAFSGIGTQTSPFGGVFDGGGHVISNLRIYSEENGLGLISIAKGGATVKDVILDNTCNIHGGSYVGGIIGCTKGVGTLTIQNCGNEGTIIGSENVAGILGCNLGSESTIVITNCYNSGSIRGNGGSSGLSGWLGDNATVTNSYNIGEVDGIWAEGPNATTFYVFARGSDNVVIQNCYEQNDMNNGFGSQVTHIDQTQVLSGELCYLLNGSSSVNSTWFQTLDEDRHPVLFNTHEVVYALGEEKFANVTTEIVEISSAQELVAFAGRVNAGENINARLTDNIDMDGVDYTAIGTETNPFCGVFYGQGHVISNLIINTNYDDQGLIGTAGDGAKIKNVILDNSCSISGGAFVGGIVGCFRGTTNLTIMKCGNEGTVSASAQNAGGILGCNYNNAQIVITDCYNSGAISGGQESAGLSGWLGNDATVTNCYNIGAIIGVEDNKTFARGGDGMSLINCYETVGNQVTQIDASKVSSGELCYLLNGNTSKDPTWFQTLNEDSHPILSNTRGIVYYENNVYTNVSTAVSINYSLNGANSTAIVTRFEREEYFGDIVIPGTIDVGGVVYTVTAIDERAFLRCGNLTSVVIPEGVTSIGEEAFGFCDNLTSVTLPSTLTSIGNYAFGFCGKLTAITIPASLTTISYGAFASCGGLTSIVVDEGNPKFDSRGDCNAIIETSTNTLIRGCDNTTVPNTVTRFGDDAFSNCHFVSFTIPESVTSLGYGTFMYCYDLTSVTIPESITCITNCAFYYCSRLASVDIPNTVTEIEDMAFGGCVSLSSLYIPASVVSVSWDSFTSCYGMTSVVVDEGNTVYDSRDNCNAIIERATNTLKCGFAITKIPSSVTSIGYGAFQGYENLESFNIPDNITSIEDNAFNECKSLTNVTLSESVTHLGSSVFDGCSDLTSVLPNKQDQANAKRTDFAPRRINGIPNEGAFIPASVTSIGVKLFSNCNKLPSIVVDENNSYFDSRDDCNAIIETSSGKLIQGCNSTVIPNGVTSIGRYAFYGCNGLISVIVPDGVSTIEDSAFEGSSLTSITIPETMTNIGSSAFSGCSSLTSVVSMVEQPFNIDGSTFSGIPTDCTLKVPLGSMDAYIAAGWTTDVFGGGIIETEPTPTEVPATIGSAGVATFCSTYNLDFSTTDEVKAYIVSAFAPSTGEVTLTRIKDVPAETGLVLLGNLGTYNIPVKNNSETVVANLLVGITADKVLSKVDGDKTNFILANGSFGLGFYTVADGSTLAAGKAYLPLTTTSLPSPAPQLSIRFDDGTTGIASPQEGTREASFYDLSGRKLDTQPKAKGLYIVNGQKVIIK